MSKRYAPDTNFFLQFKKPQELPWQDLTEEDVVELVILDEVLGELDNHKSGGNERRARRSRDVMQQLRPLLIGEQDELVVREKGPRVIYRLAPDLRADRTKPTTLDMGKADARIVEEALACSSLAYDGDLTLLSHDSLPLKLARSVGLSRQVLPDTWQLPPEPDVRNKEITRLKAEVEAWEKRAPKVVVAMVVDDRTVDRIEGRLPRYAPVSNSFLDRAMSAVVRAHPEETAGLEGQVSVYRPHDVATYVQARTEWETALREQVERHAGILNVERGLFPLELVLSNEGSVSAEHLVVDVYAEGNIRLVDLEGHHELIQKLTFTLRQPPRMRRLTELFNVDPFRNVDTSFRGLLDHGRLMPNLPGPPGRDFYWTFDEPEVISPHLNGACGDFRHQIHREVVNLALTVPWDVTEEPEGCIRIRYSAKNLTKPVEKTWPVRLEFDWCDSEGAAAGLLHQQLQVDV